MAPGVLPFIFRKEARHVLIDQPVFHLRNRQYVAIADHQFDIVEADAFGLQTVFDHLLIEAGRMLLTGDALLFDRKGDLAVAQQTRADIVIIGVETENISGFGHRLSGLSSARGVSDGRSESNGLSISRVCEVCGEATTGHYEE